VAVEWRNNDNMRYYSLNLQRKDKISHHSQAKIFQKKYLRAAGMSEKLISINND